VARGKAGRGPKWRGGGGKGVGDSVDTHSAQEVCGGGGVAQTCLLDRETSGVSLGQFPIHIT
jgi:hypothetical protein